MTTLIPKYDQGATGAVNRAINLKFAESVSIKDFGAIGNGTADDTAAIQAALNVRGSIYIPKGTYKITSALTMYGNTELYGDGPGISIIKGNGTSFGLIRDSSAVTSTDINLNITLRDFELDCNSYATGTSSGIGFYRVGNLNMDNVYIHDCGGTLLNWGTSYADTVNVNINNCRFVKARVGDATQGAGRNVTITNCYAYDIGDTCYATLRDNNGTTNPLGLYPENVLFEGCIAKGNYVNGSFTGAGNANQAGFAFGPYDVGVDLYITISNCIAENLYLNVWAVVLDKFKLIGNTFKPAAVLNSGGVRIDGVSCVTIDSNSFESSFVGSTNDYQALLIESGAFIYGASTFVASARQYTINNNVFLGNSTPALQFNNLTTATTAISDISVASNIFAGQTLPIDFSPADGSGTGIYSNITIANNTANSTSTTFVAATGVIAQYSNVILFNNNVGTGVITSGNAGELLPIVGTYRKQVASVADGVATTIFALGTNYHTIEIIAYVEGNTSAYTAAAQIINNNGSARIVWQSNGANCTLTLSTLNVQVTQSGLGAQTVTVIVKNLS